ncbi:Rod binding protein [Rhizobium sp. RU35A]|uniref:Rod-binding protein n=1 Tax=Rhizobium straminoryzae TaxID=1387186 RepID=A0A549TIF4_9HYPH|nr:MULTISPECIES: rod-binding protein [Rhizobium]TRL43028.1 rod-binding protein [Rhizobium straminoryzae]SIQ02127.1 Rod binding protein [Rhizobium sp. RU35A]
MAISPPSDLVMDVLRAADPTEVQAAQAKLKANRAAFAATSLASADKGFAVTVDRIDQTGTRASLHRAEGADKAAKMPEEYRKFEASVLQTFVNSILPSDSEQVYGKGSAGEFWKSMMSEQIANQISKSGGVGIAEQVYSQSLQKLRNEGELNARTDETERSRTLSMINDFERKALNLAPADRSEA